MNHRSDVTSPNREKVEEKVCCVGCVKKTRERDASFKQHGIMDVHNQTGCRFRWFHHRRQQGTGGLTQHKTHKLQKKSSYFLHNTFEKKNLNVVPEKNDS